LGFGLPESSWGQSAKKLSERVPGRQAAPQASGPRAGSPEAAIQARAEEGNPEALYQWGNLLERGVLGKPDLEGAVDAYRTAANKKHAPAMVAIGNALFYGRGVDVSHSKASNRYRDAAKEGNPIGMHNLGVLYERGLGVDRNEEKALEWYREAEAAKYEPAERSINRILRSRQRIDELAKRLDRVPLAEIEKRAGEGDGAALFELSQRLEAGEGIPKDEARSVELLKKAAAANHPPALSELGAALFNGTRLPKDPEQCLAVLKRAAEAKHPTGMARLAFVIHQGFGGVERDLGKALDLGLQATALGDAEAAYNVGLLYLHGWRLSEDGKTPKKEPETARDWFRIAAQRGDSNAIIALGQAYETGDGVEQNPDVAYDWYRSAAPYSTAAKEHVRRVALIDGFSAYGTHIEAVSADKSDPQQWDLIAVAMGNVYFGEGGAGGNPGHTIGYATLLRNTPATPRMSSIGMQLGCAEHAKNRRNSFEYFGYASSPHEPRAAMNLGFVFSTVPEASEKYYQEGEEQAEKAKIHVKRNFLYPATGSRSGPFVPKAPVAPGPPASPLEKSLEETTALADRGNADAQYRLGVYLLQQGDPEAAYERMTAAAEQSHPKAMLTLGQWCELGHGPQGYDDDLALKWSLLAAEAGELDGYADAAAIHKKRQMDPDRPHNPNDGHNGTGDFFRQEEYGTKGAEAGNLKSMCGLADFYSRVGAAGWKTPAELTKLDKELDLDLSVRAVRWLRAAAERGDAASMLTLARHYEQGRGADKNDEEAMKWFVESANAGHEPAVIEAVTRLFAEKNSTIDRKAAEILNTALKKNPESNDLLALYAAALENGQGYEKNEIGAKWLVRRLVRRGHQPSIKTLERLEPHTARIRELRWELAHGSTRYELYVELARAYLTGAGVSQEPALGIDMAYRASLSGNPEHVAFYAATLADLDIRPVSLGSLVPELQKVVDQGHPRSVAALGQMCLAAQGVPADDARGFELLEKAAKLGDAGAMHLLGKAYLEGLGTPACAVVACDWFEKAAAKGNIPSMIALASIQESGREVPADERAASRWFAQAAEAGDRDAALKAASLVTKLLDFSPAESGGDAAAPLDLGATRKKSEAGDAQSQFLIGRMQLEGIGALADVVQGRLLIEKAAGADLVDACRYLAKLYRTGDHIPADEKFASYWELRTKQAEQLTPARPSKKP